MKQVNSKKSSLKPPARLAETRDLALKSILDTVLPLVIPSLGLAVLYAILLQGYLQDRHDRKKQKEEDQDAD